MFCFRHFYLGNGAFESYGNLDKRKLEAARIRPVLSDQHGTRAAQQLRRVRQRIDAECEVANDADHQFTAVELSGVPQPNQHLHEHATCYNVRGKGLMVITFCGHGGIINTVRRAREITGVR